MDKTSRRIIDYAKAFDGAQLGPAALEKATGVLFDTIACAIVGAQSEPVRILGRIAGRIQSSAGATVIGHGVRTSPEIASLANAAAVRTYDYNDAYYGHPSDMIPGILAAGEVAHSSGTQVLEAVCLAYEIYGAFSRSGPHHLDSGLDYGLSMNMGVALGVGRLWNLNEEQLAHAASLSLVPNLPMGAVRWGALSMMKGAGTAFSVRNGVFAAMLAQEGFDAPNEPYDGIFGLKHFTGAFELRLPLSASKRVIEMVYIKPMPAENNTIGILELVPEIRQWAPVDAIESIDIQVATGLDVHMADEPKYDPLTRETADHSLPYVLARALVDGGITLESYSAQRITDPSIRPLMRKVRVMPDADMKATMTNSAIDQPENKPARITLRTRDGRTMTRDLMGHGGHPDRPAQLRREILDRKLDACARAVGMGERQREEVRRTWWDIARCQDIATAMSSLQHFEP